MTSKVVRLGLLAILTVLATTSSRAAEPLNIPVILPLTGGAAFLGKAEQDALQRYEKVVAATGGVHGRPLHFVISDDQSSPQVAVQLTNEAKGSSSPVILGSALSALCNAMIPLVRTGPVMFCFSPSIAPPPEGYVYSSGVSVPDLASTVLRYFSGRGWKRVAIITATDATGQDATRNLKTLLATPDFKDIEVVADVQFNTTDVSVSSQMQRIKGAHPDALITWSTGSPIGTVFRGIRDAGLDIPVSTPNGNMIYELMDQYASFLPKNLYIPTAQWPKLNGPEPAGIAEAKDVFFKAYEATGAKPDAPSTFAWDPAVMVVEALRKLKPDATANDLRTYLDGLQDFSGINGRYDMKSIPHRGIDGANVIMTRWDPASRTWVAVSEGRGVLSSGTDGTTTQKP